MSWFKSIPAEKVHEQGSVSVEVDGLRLALFSLDGEIHATGNICTHAFALLADGYVEGGFIECPLHQGLFDIRTGKAQGTPVTEDIDTYAVKVEDGIVWIDTTARQRTVEAADPACDQATACAAKAPADTRRLVIVGGGQAGAETAMAARKHGFTGPIAIIGDEPHPPYERPPLSKDLLLGRATLADTHVLAPEEAERLGITLLTATTVRRIDRVARQVELSQGEPLPYDLLVIATGAQARRITPPGSETVTLHYLRHAADSAALGAALRKAHHVAVIGGGFIGLELASAARALGAKAAVIESRDRLMSRVLPPEASAHLAELARKHEVALHLGQGVAAVSPEGVTLEDGRLIAADCIVVGVGAEPNDALARQCGLATGANGGIAVDADGRTSDPAIYAVGDVALRYDAASGAEQRLESWQNARLSAERCGRAIAGAPPAEDELPWFWSDLFGGTTQIVGLPTPALKAVPYAGSGAAAFFCVDKAGHVVSAVDFGNPQALRLARKLIASGEPFRQDPPRSHDSPCPHDNPCAHDSGFSPFDKEEMETPMTQRYAWPDAGLNRVPDWVYTDEEIYRREVERIFHGRTWNYVALEAEIPNAGDYIRSNVGPTPVVVVRDRDGGVNVFENRCSHRAAEFCRELRGNTTEFVCPYHQWSYDLKGNLAGIPFRRGAGGKGGMGPDFRPEDHGVRTLSVARRGGAVFASFAEGMESFEDYLGPDMLKDYDAVFNGRKLKVLGHYRHTLMGNWKLYHENLKDPYHATLLHTFLVTFGLLVAGNESAMIVDPKGRHSTMASAKSDGTSVSAENRAEMRAYRDGMSLSDSRLMDYVAEFDSPWSVTMQVIWPNLIVQREMNTLGVRHIVPNGPNKFVMVWTMFGYEDDDEDMTRHRLRQGNLMGPAGFLGIEDNEAIKFVQDGMLHSTGGAHLVALDPKVPAGTSDTLISEAAIRALYAHWREEMGL